MSIFIEAEYERFLALLQVVDLKAVHMHVGSGQLEAN